MKPTILETEPSSYFAGFILAEGAKNRPAPAEIYFASPKLKKKAVPTLSTAKQARGTAIGESID